MKPFLRTPIRIVLGLVFLCLLIGVPSSVIVLQRLDLQEIIKRQIKMALERENFQIHIGHLSFCLFHGFIADNVVLRLTKENAWVGNAKRVTFSLNLLGFLAKRPLIKKIHLYGASLDIPLLEDDIFHIRNADAKIVFIRDRLEISNAKFTFENIQFLVSGSLSNLQMLKSRSQPSPEQKKAHLQKLRRLVNELKKIHYAKGPAQAEIALLGDFSQPMPLQIPKIRLHAEQMRYQNLFLQRLQLNASYVQGSLLHVHHLAIQDSTGELITSGTANFKVSKAHLVLYSSLNPIPILTEFVSNPNIQNLKKIRMKSLHASLNGNISWGSGKPQYKGTGSAVLYSLAYKNSFFPLLELQLAANKEIVELQHLYIQDSKGKLVAWGAADLNATTTQFILSSSLNPVPILRELFSNTKIQKLKNLNLESPPQMDLNAKISWENGKLQCNGTGSLALRSFSYKKSFFPQLNLQFRAKNGVLEIKQLSIQDSKGTLIASGTADLTASKGHMDLRSSLDLIPILREWIPNSQITQNLQDLHMKSPPKVNLNGDISWVDRKFQYNGIGSATLQSVSYKQSYFSQLDLKFAVETNRSLDLRLQTQSGMLQTKISMAPNNIEIHADSTLNPKEFVGFFDAKTRDFFRYAEIIDPPHITLHLKGPKFAFASLSGSGNLTLGRTAVRGVWIDFARSKIELAQQAITCRDFVLGRNAERGSGTATYNFKQKHIRFQNIISTFFPYDVMLWIDPHIAQILSVYKFHAPPHIQLNGLIHLADHNLNNLSIHIQSEAGLNYNLLKRTLNFGPTHAEVHVNGPWVIIHIPSAQIFQGTAALAAKVSIDPKKPIFNVDISASHLHFASITKLYFNYEKSKGFLSGNYAFQARIGKEEDMIGGGSVRIDDGNVVSIPFLGPLSVALNQIIPGAGYEPSKQAVANFGVANHKIRTQNLQIVGTGFSLFGKGNIDFITGKMYMSIRVNARGLPGLLFFPVSKLFEFESRGSAILNSQWHLKPLIKFGQ